MKFGPGGEGGQGEEGGEGEAGEHGRDLESDGARSLPEFRPPSDGVAGEAARDCGQSDELVDREGEFRAQFRFCPSTAGQIRSNWISPK